jgi:calmodulin
MQHVHKIVAPSTTSSTADYNKSNEEQIRQAFQLFDPYGNGLVNLNQMKISLQNLGERLRDEEIDELIREADIDTDGNVSYDELVKILCHY